MAILKFQDFYEFKLKLYKILKILKNFFIDKFAKFFYFDFIFLKH